MSERRRGSATGALILTAFGAAWIVLGLAGWIRAIPVWIAIFIPGAVLLAVAVRRLGEALEARDTGEPTSASRAIGRAFLRINLVQWAAIAVVVIVCGELDRPDRIPGAIGVIVGVHFFPLARLFRRPSSRITGTCLIAAGVAGLVAPATGPAVNVVCIAIGAILWLTAAAALVERFPDAPAAVPAEEQPIFG